MNKITGFMSDYFLPVHFCCQSTCEKTVCLTTAILSCWQAERFSEQTLGG